MTRIFLIFCFLVIALIGVDAQHQQNSGTDTINSKEIETIVRYLASDRLKGRVNFTNEQLAAAEFIGKYFHFHGLAPLPGYSEYFIPFAPYNKKSEKELYNIVAFIPGKSKPGEIVIFSAHYDHVASNVDPAIFNGANDNASGTSAVMLLAKYFSMRNDNERSLVFCAFAGEELGLLGSYHFAELIKADSVVTNINIEMIGRSDQYGKGGIFITGSSSSDFSKIFSAQLRGTGIKIKQEASSSNDLFERSDNYPFFLKEIPAHTIMASGDEDPCYHQPCDDAESLDFENMAILIKGIARGCETIISGKETPLTRKEIKKKKKRKKIIPG